MKFNKIFKTTVLTGVLALGAVSTATAFAGTVNSTPVVLNLQATVTPSASITVAPTSAASALYFSNHAGTTGNPETGGNTATISAAVTTAFDNSPTITVLATDLSAGPNDTNIPISNLSFTTADTSNYSNNFSTTADGTVFTDYSAGLSESSTSSAVLFATLPVGSGAYTFVSTFSLNIPQNANADTYTATLTYEVLGA